MPPPTYAAQWDECWSHVDNQTWYPDEQVVRFLARHVARRTGPAPREVIFASGERPAGLDLGCGKGRHVLLMAELGVEAFGSDVSPKAVEFARGWLRTRGLSAELSCGSMDKLPHPDARFDFVLCHGVLDHSLKSLRASALAEVERVLKPGGLFFFSVISEEDSAFGKGKPVEEKTWLLNEGFESGIPQAFFSLERVRDEFSRFALESVVRCECRSVAGRSLIGSDKHYEADSRWYATGRKKP